MTTPMRDHADACPRAELELVTCDALGALRHVAACLARRSHALLDLVCRPEADGQGRLVLAVADDGRLERLVAELRALPEILAAHLGHWGLYALMLAIPLSGWLMSSAKGFQTVWFGVLPLPDLLDKDKALGNTLQTVHAVLNLGLIGLLLAHVGAALKHHFLQRDDVLTRMLPRRR